MSRALALRIGLAAVLWLAASPALGIERPCSPGKVWDQNLGACTETQEAPVASPRENYNRALAILERKSGTRRAIPLLSRACRARLGAACTQLGFVYKTGRHIEADPDRSLKSYQRGCQLGDVPGCLGAAEHHAEGLGGTQDWKQAFALYQRACELGSGAGCYRSAEALTLGRGVSADRERGRKLFATAFASLELECKAERGPSCHLLGLALRHGNGVAADLPRSLAVLARGCDAGAGDACFQLGIAYRDGLGTSADRAAAQRVFQDACRRYDSGDACFAAGQLLAERGVGESERKVLEELGQRACDLDQKHCLLLARLLDTGALGEAQPVRALELTDQACDHGNGLACFDAGLKRIDGPERFRDPRAGLTRIDRACQLDYHLACEQMALYRESGELIPEDHRRALELRARACRLGYGPSCSEGGRALLEGRGGLAKRGDKARSFFQVGCATDGESCFLLAELYRDGAPGVKKDPTRSLRAFRTACKRGYAGGCSELGELFLALEDEEKNRRAAREWFSHACRLGAEAPCAWVIKLADDGSREEVAETVRVSCEEAGNESACLQMAWQMSFGGEVFPRDERRGFRLVKPACEERRYHPACILLSDLYGTGVGTIRQPDKAESILVDLCSQDVPRACTKLGHRYLAARDYNAALPLYRRACADGDPSACNNYAYHHFVGLGTEWDLAVSERFWQRACDEGSSTGCVNLAESLEYGIGMDRDESRAAELYRGACSVQSNTGCGPLGRLELRRARSKEQADAAIAHMRRGCHAEVLPDALACRVLAETLAAQSDGTDDHRDVEVARLVQRAVALAEAAHESGNPYAAFVLGSFYRDGFGVIRDARRATTLLATSCTGYDPRGCLAAGDLHMQRGELYAPDNAAVYYQRACAATVVEGCRRARDARRAAELPLRPKPAQRGCSCEASGTGGGWFMGALLAGLLVLLWPRRHARP